MLQEILRESQCVYKVYIKYYSCTVVRFIRGKLNERSHSQTLHYRVLIQGFDSQAFLSDSLTSDDN